MTTYAVSSKSSTGKGSCFGSPRRCGRSRTSPRPPTRHHASGMRRALYFDNISGFTDARIAMNVHGSWANHALALELPKETGTKQQVEEFIRRWAEFPVRPEWREHPCGPRTPRTGTTSTSSRCFR
ncbi:hypothetical protein ACFQ51_00320 [Streptomyces kaempferi]